MALESIPPWLQVTPQFFTSALEAGARAGLAVSEQNRRAEEVAAAQAERQAQQAERQREFEQTRLLNVQKIAQDAARLEQTQQHQAAQESRLLDYQQGLIGLRQQQANRQPQFVEGQAGMFPSHILDERGSPHFFPEGSMGAAQTGPELQVAYDPDKKTRIGLFSRRGDKSWQFVPDATDKPITVSNTIAAVNAIQRGILAELNTVDALAALRDKDDPRHQYYLDRQSKLGGLTQQLEDLNKKTPTVLAPTNAVPRVTATNAPPPVITPRPLSGVYPHPELISPPMATNAPPTVLPATNAEPGIGATLTRRMVGKLEPGTNAPTGESITHSPLLVRNKAERDALPKGTVYIGPDGRTYTKQ